MQQEIRQVIELAKSFRDEAVPLLGGAPQIQINLKHVMDRLIGSLTHAAGISSDGSEKRGGKPLTHIAGAPIGKPAEPMDKAITPTKEEVIKMMSDAEEASDSFLTFSAEHLRDLYSDIVIRIVAGHAGMTDVSPTNPAKITIAFIAQVKEAVAVKNEQWKQVKEAMQSATRGIDDKAPAIIIDDPVAQVKEAVAPVDPAPPANPEPIPAPVPVPNKKK